MIQLPDFEKKWEYENGFYLTCHPTRMSKFIAHYELFNKATRLPGEIVECGVFKGASLARFAMFRDLFGNSFSKKIIAFDTFGEFPDPEYEPDEKYKDRFVESAGEESISVDQMMDVLENKGCEKNVELVEGDILNTVPEYVEKNPHLKISLLNIDTDIYGPAKTILNTFIPRVVGGGVIILDDYGTFPGETKAVDEYFDKHDINVNIEKFPFAMTPSFIIKNW